MAIELTKAVREEALTSIQRYFQENMEEPLGNLAAGALLDFFLEEIGPCVYNKAVADVQARLQTHLIELDIELREEAFGYWWRHGPKRKGT